jgi:hypothetical protein
MQNGAVTYRDILANHQWQTIRLPGAFVGDMQNAPILDIAARTNGDAIYITPDNRHRPYRHIIPQQNRASDGCFGVNINPGAQLRMFVHKTVNISVIRGIHNARMVSPLLSFMHRLNVKPKIISL